MGARDNHSMSTLSTAPRFSLLPEDRESFHCSCHPCAQGCGQWTSILMFLMLGTAALVAITMVREYTINHPGSGPFLWNRRLAEVTSRHPGGFAGQQRWLRELLELNGVL